MALKQLAIVALGLALAGCGGERQGVGLGQVGAGGDPATLPASTRTEFEMAGLAPLPVYRFSQTGPATPAAAMNAGGSDLRLPSQNIEIVQESRTYFMRQIELNGSNYVVSEGAAPVASLVTVIRARTGCLVDPQPLRSDDAAVYTLDCS